ncbi:hemerythrin domain-containing protein [Rubripirellula reticaptiva]|uniref:Hemerythrin-like domain-containing protein n=1 Tax=Rubripirellula reticaptiva TaxID=2528013 RepID=A0A5C6F9X7_9BACT|nr:hemerythrin domain-containing protein [Rubripirellula reticaptiva]TWU58245.1 hypothetical protein Poly59_11560 [Rubripirellula reticaptiva]
MERSISPIVGRTISDTKRRLSVNAAFLKDIKDDNRELKCLIDKLDPLAEHAQTAANHWPEITALLGDFRDQLALHFSLEEAFGYFEEAIEVAPQMSITAEQLRGEHTGLFESIRELADKASEISPDQIEKVSTFLTRLKQFRHTLEQHEEAEVNLILESFGDDLGNGD